MKIGTINMFSYLKALLWGVVLALAIQMLYSLLDGISSYLISFLVESEFIIELISNLVAIAIFGIILVCFMNKFFGDIQLGLTCLPNTKWIMFSLLILTSYLLIKNNTLDLITSFFPVNPLIAKAADRINDSNVNQFIFSICISGPIIEEIATRGIILNRLYKKYNAASAIILSAFAFAIVHFDLHQGINAFIVGCIFGYLYVRTHSILLCIILHMLSNLYITLSYFYPHYIYKLNEQFDMREIFFGMIFLICGLIVNKTLRTE